MRYFPLFVDTQKLSVLVVGAGDVAARKLDLLCRTDASITVIALSACDEVLELANQQKICLILREVDNTDIRDINLLYMATSESELNHKMAAIAYEQNILANVVDAPDDCTFITPAIVDRGKLQIAISSSGVAPVFVSQLRARIETWLPHSISELMDFVASKRVEVQGLFKSGQNKRHFWRQFFDTNGTEYTDLTANTFTKTKGDMISGKKSLEKCKIILLDQASVISKLPISVVPILQQVETVFSEANIPVELNELIRRDATRAKFTCVEELNLDLCTGRILIFSETDKLKDIESSFSESFYLNQ